MHFLTDERISAEAATSGRHLRYLPRQVILGPFVVALARKTVPPTLHHAKKYTPDKIVPAAMSTYCKEAGCGELKRHCGPAPAGP